LLAIWSAALVIIFRNRSVIEDNAVATLVAVTDADGLSKANGE